MTLNSHEQDWYHIQYIYEVFVYIIVCCLF